MRFLFVLVAILGLIAADGWASAQPDCPGAPAPRLIVGEFGRVLPGDANNMRDVPSREGVLTGQIPGGEQFQVLDGPVCANDLNWWQVDYLGLIGWTVEGSGEEYFIETLAAAEVIPTPTTTPIPAAPASPFRYSTYELANMVEVGARVRVNTIGTDALIVRENPGISANEVTRLEDETLLTIIDGPLEQDSLTWWQIETDDSAVTGWAIEGFIENTRFYPSLVPLCSFAGERIAFIANDSYEMPDTETTEEGVPNLYTIGIDGSNLCNLTYFSPEDQRFVLQSSLWSPDGAQIAFVAGELFTINSDGTGLKQLTRESDTFWRMLWSPDGTEIAFGRTLIDQTYPQLWVTDLSGDRLRSLTSEDGYHHLLGWTPNTQQVLYSFEPEGTGDSLLKFINSDLSSPQSFREAVRTNLFGSWSPDGTSFALSLVFAPDYLEQIFLIERESGDLTRLTGVDGGEYPVWSPDGSHIAYWRNELTSEGLATELDLMLIEPVEADPIILVPKVSNFIDVIPPVWSLDSTQVIYAIEREGVYAVDVQGGDPRLIFAGLVVDDGRGWKDAISVQRTIR